jgi:hypothetical protein
MGDDPCSDQQIAYAADFSAYNGVFIDTDVPDPGQPAVRVESNVTLPHKIGEEPQVVTEVLWAKFNSSYPPLKLKNYYENEVLKTAYDAESRINDYINGVRRAPRSCLEALS